MSELVTSATVVHIRFDGESHDIPLDALGLGPRPSDAKIKEAIARYLEVPESGLRSYVVDHHATGNLTVRPQAVFG